MPSWQWLCNVSPCWLTVEKNETPAPCCSANAPDRSGDLALDDARTAHFHSDAVQFLLPISQAFSIRSITVGVLDLAQRATDLPWPESPSRGVKRNPLGREEPEQPGDPQACVFAPVRRQEMDLASLGDGRFDPLAELRQRQRLADADAPRACSSRVGCGPIQMMSSIVSIVAVERFLARVDIHQPYVVGTVQAEEV